MKLLCFSSQPPNISKNKSENLIDLNIQEMRCYLESKIKLSGGDFKFKFVTYFGMLGLHDTTNY